MEIKTSVKDIYSIPYNSIPYGCNVVVYGAGKVGEFYVRDIIETKRYNLVGVVDADPNKTLFGLDIKIYSPKQIPMLSFEIILIAVEKYNVAMQIKNTLMEMNVAPSKIIWNGNCETVASQKVSQEYQKFLERNLYKKQGKCFLFMLPEHGNAGDYAIGYAEIKFLNDYFPQYELITVTTTEWLYASEYIIKHVGRDDLIFLNGGGYIGDLWEDTPNYMSVIEAFPENTKVFFPNTLTYKVAPDSSYEPFVNEMKWVNKQKKLYTFFRDLNSYKLFNSYDSRSFYGPDMVLYNHYKRNSTHRNLKVLFCFRNDIEKIYDGQSILKNRLESKGFDVDEMDIHACRYVSQQAGYGLVGDISKKMQEYDCVITDRLHGMLLATISDVPCIAFDNLTRKVSGVYKWIEHFRYVRCLSPNNIEDVLGNIDEVIEMKECAEYSPLSQFEDMAKIIDGCIRGEC